ncbi:MULTISPECIES: hypothetical protein [Clostridium]|uniref:Uncharacterized protein n=1 Tax=Clostridium lapidicellarium TaxID=3240931 RepID=A0ABV4DTN7_9CLOT|nr:hypothetical protein [uncultured Clostridium sp.]NLU08946.1 hypothetical protein [Clostridiales bacterium]
MPDLHFYSSEHVNELEMCCILLVEKELDMFFSPYMEQKVVHSIMLSDNLILHGKENFMDKILSDCKIKECVESILYKISIKIGGDGKYPCLNSASAKLVENCYSEIIEETVNNAGVTQVITSICEYVIDFSTSYILSETCGSSAVGKLLKWNISGEKILDRNNLANQRKEHQKLMHRQIKGLLMNIKLNIRYQLIRVCITKNYYKLCIIKEKL